MSAGEKRHARRGGALCVAFCCAVLAGCAASLPPMSPAEGALRESIVENALGEVGRPYRYGGESPDGFDCSGLVQYTYSLAGMQIPRSTDEQMEAGQHIKLEQARPGDLLFYRFGLLTSSLHVAIYLGDGQMVHAPASGKQVTVTRIDQSPWPDRFIRAVRLLR